MREVVLVSGRICTGKSGLARRLRDEFDYTIIKTSDILDGIAKTRAVSLDRSSLQRLGDELDSETGGRWVFDEVFKLVDTMPIHARVVVDNIRVRSQLEHFRNCHDWEVVHAHLYAPIAELKARFTTKCDRGLVEAALYEAADLLKNDDDIEFFKSDADVRINTQRSDGVDTLVRVAARLGLYSPPDIRCVDVVVGGQYGSEGKGNIVAYLSRDYDVLVRVGGPNAGHTVSGPSGVYVYHQLPSGCRDNNSKLLLGPGMTIRVPSLLKEIAECNVGPERLFIDPNAMIIGDEDIEREEGVRAGIASTKSGSGSAAARKILNRDQPPLLARDIPELAEYVGAAPNYRGSTTRQLEIAYRLGCSILLEGTQGSGLSLFHGSYPHVTSRDTNVAGCLAEVGISPARVRRIMMVVRTTPIRVGNPEGGTSGPLKRETDFETIAKDAGIDDAEGLKEDEKTSTTKRPRRVGWFEWEQFRQACALNAPTDIVLTFADYLDVKNRDAHRFEQLSDDTIRFIEELEGVAHAPVSIINTRFPKENRTDLRSLIDRRNWMTKRALE